MPLRGLLALFVLVFATLLTAAAAAAAASPPDLAATGSTVVTSSDPSSQVQIAPEATASAASVAPPATTVAGSPGGAPVAAGPSSGPSPILYSSTPAPAPAPSLAADVRPQPAVIAVGSAGSPLGHPDRNPTGASGSHVNPGPSTRVNPGPSSVSSARHVSPTFRPTITQLASGGPFVAASGSTAVAVAVAAPVGRAPRSARAGGQVLPLAIAPPAGASLRAVAAVSVPLVDVYIGGATSARHPGQKPTPPAAEPVGPAGLPATTISPFGAGRVKLPSGMTPLFGSAPFSSAGGGMAPLVELSAMLAAMTLLGRIAGGRRAWDPPVPRGESALLVPALDRPG